MSCAHTNLPNLKSPTPKAQTFFVARLVLTL
jgi:hypothetical protein